MKGFINNPPLERVLRANGYYALRVLPNGQIAGLYNFIFTVGLCYNLDYSGYEGRYCYDKTDAKDAYNAIATWDGKGAPSGNWVKHK